MGTISEKLTYLNTTKTNIKDAINLTGANITNATFRSYPDKLKSGLLNAINNGTDTIWNNWEKVTGTGTSITLNNTVEAPMNNSVEGRSVQNTTQGNQLWNYYTYPVNTTKNGVTVTNYGDGTIELDGTCDADNTSFFLASDSTIIKGYNTTDAVTHTAYYISGSCTKAISGNNKRTVIRLNYNLAASTMIRLDRLQGANKITATSAKRADSVTGWSWDINIDNGDSFNHLKFKYQLNYGETALPWEEYTGGQASPNPAYPQAINSVGDNVNYLPIDVVSETTNGVTVTRLNDGTFKLNGTSTADTFLELYNGENVTLSAGTYTGSIGNRKNLVDGYIRLGEWGAYKTIFDSTHDTNTFTIDEPFTFNRFYIYFSNNKTFNNQIIKPELSLGTLVKPYAPHNEYNIGSISIEKCNKNRYSSELELGSINTTTGQNSANDNCVRSKDYIYVAPNTQCTISNDKNYDNVVYQYDKNKDFIRADSLGSGTQTFTTQATCYYLRNRTSFGNVQNDLTTKFQLELGSTATTYIAHQSQTYPIYTQSPFRDIGEVRDDFAKIGGVWYERHKIKSVVLNGTEDWVNAGNFFRLADDMFPQSTSGGVITPSYCNYYLPQTYNDIYNASVDYGFAFSNASHRLVVRNKDFTTKEQFTTWLGTHNIEVVFEASEPTLTQCTDEQVEQLEALSQAKSYEGQTNIYSNDVVVPYLDCVALKNI